MTVSAVWLECPVCEYRFSVPEDFASKKGKCPKCDNAFEAADCRLSAEEKNELDSARANLDVPPPRILESIEASSPAGSKKAPLINEPVLAGEIDADADYNQSYVAAKKNQVNPTQVLLVIVGSCVLAVVLFISIPLIAKFFVKKNNDQQAKNLPTNQTNNGGPPQNGLNPNGSNPSGKNKKKAPKKKAQTSPTSIRENVWKNSSHRVVKVNVTRGQREITLYGTTLQNEGHVVTALDRVDKAKSITIQVAANSMGTSVEWQQESLVAHLVASNPEFNLAVLKVDGDLSGPRTDGTLAAQDKVLVPAANTKNSSSLLRFGKAESIAPIRVEDQQTLQDSGFVGNATSNFIFHTLKIAKNGVGLPLLNQEGEVAGIHCFFSEQLGTGIGVPIDMLNTKPIAAPEKQPRTVATKKAEPGKKEDPVMETTESLISGFEKSMANMKTLEWKFVNPDDYQAACEFTLLLDKIQTELKTSNDFNHKLKIEKLLEQLAQDRKELLFWPQGAVKAKINKQALDHLAEKKDGWVGLVIVEIPSGLYTDIDDEPALLAKVIDTNERVILLPGDVEGPFLQEKEFIIFGHNKQKRRLKTSTGVHSVIDIVAVRSKR